ncbi:MAG TPA: hypothetical protein VF720_12975 [Candidatus Eisenbacteria bacterium]
MKPSNRTTRTSPRITAALLLVATLGLSSCGGTGFQQTFVEPTAVGVALKKVAVVGAANDTTLRRSFESRFARTLDLRGNDARAGYEFITEPMRTDLNSIKNKLVEENFDGVLVTRLGPSTTDITRSFEGNLASPGPASEGDLQLRTSLYRVKDGRLLWDAVTKSARGGNPDDAIASFSETVARELGAQGILR